MAGHSEDKTYQRMVQTVEAVYKWRQIHNANCCLILYELHGAKMESFGAVWSTTKKAEVEAWEVIAIDSEGRERSVRTPNHHLLEHLVLVPGQPIWSPTYDELNDGHNLGPVAAKKLGFKWQYGQPCPTLP